MEKKEVAKPNIPMAFTGLEADTAVDMTETNAEMEKQKALMKELVEGNDDINKKYKQIQADKAKKLKEYKEMIVKMRKEKRASNKDVQC